MLSNFHLNRLTKTTSILALSASLAFFGQPAQKAPAQQASGQLSGAGATSIQPLVDNWFTSRGVTYSLVGSGAGRSQFSAGTTDFASTDLSLAGLPANRVVINPVNIPVGFVYNVAGAPNRIRLSNAQVCGIISGAITNWNTINPRIPSTPIRFFYRSDSSGTTEILSSFVTNNCPRLRVPPFPVGTGVARSSGIINAVRTTNGSIGYVDTPAAVAAGLNTATLDTRIEGPNFLVFRRRYATADKAAAARNLCKYVFSRAGRAVATSKGYTVPNASPNRCNAIQP
jgi:ABC-type phosphate transport system substrate-binding protein